MTAPADARELLARVPLFADLSTRSLRRLVKLCVVRRYPAGSVLIEQGSTGLGLYVLTAGTVDVTYEGRDGRRHLATLGSGEVVGELALIDDRPRSASVVATADTECLLITRNGFRELVQRDPEIAWVFVPVLAERLRELQEMLDAGGGSAPAPPPPEGVTESPDGAAAAAPPAASQARCETATDEAADRRQDSGLRDLLQAQHALARAGVCSADAAVAVAREFLDTLLEETGLDGEGPTREVVRSLPSGLAKATTAALKRGERAPETVLATLRHHLRRRDR